MARTSDRLEASISIADLKVSDESPCSDLELEAVASFHFDPVITEECGAARGHPGPRRDTKPDVPYQVEDAKDRSVSWRSIAQVHPHVADESHDLLIRPSIRKGALRYVAQEREHGGSRRRTLFFRERRTQTQPARAPRTMIARITQSAGPGEKFTSACMSAVWSAQPRASKLPGVVPDAGFSVEARWATLERSSGRRRKPDG